MGLLIDGKIDRLSFCLIAQSFRPNPPQYQTIINKARGNDGLKYPPCPENDGLSASESSSTSGKLGELLRCDISSNIAHAMMRWPWVVTSYGAYRRWGKWLNHRL